MNSCKYAHQPSHRNPASLVCGAWDVGVEAPRHAATQDYKGSRFRALYNPYPQAKPKVDPELTPAQRAVVDLVLPPGWLTNTVSIDTGLTGTGI